MGAKQDVSSSLKDIQKVIQLADSDLNILATPIPTDFLEEKPNDILKSFTEYVKEHPLEDTDANNSVQTKIQNNEYNGFYPLFHDIKISCSSLIQKHKVGSSVYNQIDFFYKFSTELLLRESSRLRLALKTSDPVSETDFESQFADDFEKISSNYASDNGEVIYLINKIDDPAAIQQPLQNSLYPNLQQQQEPPKQINQPLFTSLTGKSSVDVRPTLVPDPYQLTQVVPTSRSAHRESAKLNTLSPAVLKIPPPTNQPTEMMNNFFHPNWYTLAVPSWLNYQGTREQVLRGTTSFTGKSTSEINSSKVLNSYVNSFAPSVDLRSSIISLKFKSNIWLEQIGLDEINNIRERFLELKKPVVEESIDVETEAVDKEMAVEKSEEKILPNGDESLVETVNGQVEPTEASVTDKTNTTEAENETDPEKETDAEPETETEAKASINIDNLVTWDPSKIELLRDLQEDTEKITESPKSFQRLISVNLIKLNKLRQKRYVGKDSSPNPSVEEIKLYQKTMKLISLFMNYNSVSIDQLSLQFSKRLPVLMNEYVGSLPGSVVPTKTYPAAATKNARLPSIRGPYKKKNRM